MDNSTKNTDQFPKMKIFQSAQKYFAMAGISRANPFNWKILVGFLILIAILVCTVIYAIYEAKTFCKYTQSAYGTSLVIGVIFILMFIVLKTDKLIQFIEDLESLINTRGY